MIYSILQSTKENPIPADLSIPIASSKSSRDWIDLNPFIVNLSKALLMTTLLRPLLRVKIRHFISFHYTFYAII